MYQPKLTVKTAAELKAILGKDFPSQVAKIIDHIDPHCRTWIEQPGQWMFRRRVIRRDSWRT